MKEIKNNYIVMKLKKKIEFFSIKFSLKKNTINSYLMKMI